MEKTKSTNNQKTFPRIVDVLREMIKGREFEQPFSFFLIDYWKAKARNEKERTKWLDFCRQRIFPILISCVYLLLY